MAGIRKITAWVSFDEDQEVDEENRVPYELWSDYEKRENITK